MLWLALLLLLAAALAEGACDKEHFTRKKFDEFKTDPYQKIIVLAPAEKLEGVCEVLESYSRMLSTGLGVATYILDPLEESEENLKLLHYREGEASVYVQAEDGTVVRYSGELGPNAERTQEQIKEDVQYFIEIRLAMVGDNLLLPWPKDDMEGVVDGGKRRVPALVCLSASPRHMNFFGRMATRNKGGLRVYTVDCAGTWVDESGMPGMVALTRSQRELCEMGPGMLFVDDYRLYESDIRMYRFRMGDGINEFKASKWIDGNMAQRHPDDFVVLPRDQDTSDVRKCMPSCGESKKALHAAPNALRGMVDELARRVEQLH